MNSECEPKREPEVSGQIAHLEKVIAELDESVESLRVRIEPILKSQPLESLDRKTPAEVDDIVPLAMTIRQFRAKVKKSKNDIRDMIAACEL